ncbi:MAG: peptide-methionine (R)-S-oxide reductase MsrB [Thiothrix sp.]|nr:peptide-methionine (R)-S-oxide reductase MsrB [Thiothrix sp.]HPQ94550.1 peptide-methionine (R)-S-oxide reductase MsrB [Thiolinea sp.]
MKPNLKSFSPHEPSTPVRRRFLRHTLGLGLIAGSAYGLGSLLIRSGPLAAAEKGGRFEISYSAAEWRRLLSPQQYYVLREQGTEARNSSPLLHEKRAGRFHCAGCDLPLYDAKTKYDSGTGWPSFYAALDNAVGYADDSAFFMTRTEVHCRRCGGHLGHVFDDGPAPTGKRHCINGVALGFRAA